MTWLTLQEIIDLGVSRQTLNRRIKSGQWLSRIGARRGSRNGTAMREVKLESLPQDLQLMYLKAQRSESSDDDSSLTTEPINAASESHARPPQDGTQPMGTERRLMESLVRYEPAVRDAFLHEAQRLADIIERYDSINPKRTKIGPGKHEFVPGVKQLCRDAVCEDRTVLSIEPKRAKEPSPHTLENWSKSFRSDGLAAFLRKPPEQRSTIDKRKAEISTEAVEWLNAHWKTKPSPRALHRALKKEAAKRKWKIPSYGWVWRKYESLPKIVATATFEGEKKLAGKWSVYVPRTVEDLTALQLLCGDHSVRDVTVMLPDGQLTRPWLTTWLDLRTDLIWGWHLDLTPSSNTIGLAYVNGVQNFGAQPLSRPDDDFFSYLYTDQGKDYRCKTLTGETLIFKNAARIEGGLSVLCAERKVGFMEELGIKHMMARGYNAKEKPVERLHADISRWEQNTFEDEYCGKDTVSKPDRWTKAWAKHQRLLKKFGPDSEWLQQESPFMTLEDYRDNLAGWINWHNHEAHTRTVLGGKKIVPVDEYQRLYTTRYEISDEALALLLMRRDLKKIGKNGVTMLNNQYLCTEMAAFKGEEIEVRYSEGDYSRVWAVLPNNQIVEAEQLVRSSIIKPNKKTHEAVARQKAHERKVIRDARLIEQSNWRGETAEDRVARLINPEDVNPPEAQKKAVNAPTIHNLTRFDRLKLAGASGGGVTVDQVENANVIEGMFGEERQTPRIKEEWED